ncbi:MAG: 50S ribosomal protein L3 [Erysipelotrichales bacterium]|nr:50S ribosomal protein L3 [Erysipelotrichales bacterium]
MAKGILGKKVGMTQIFDGNGNLIPVTVLLCTPNVVIQQKNVETDGYVATQLGFDEIRPILVNKPLEGHFKKAGAEPKRFLKEFRFKEGLENELQSLEVGTEVNCDIFNDGEIVDVTATSKGKGFAGVIKRYNHSRGPMAHGSGYHRGIGSMGPIKGNMKGKKMPGQMGHETVTLNNVVIVKVDKEKNVILVKGNVPGPKKGLVELVSAVKPKK